MDSRRLIPAIECNDQTLLVFGIVYVARLYFAMLVLWSRPPDWHEIPIVYVFFIPSIFYTMARGKIDECSAPVTALAVALYVIGSGFSTIGEYQRYVFKKQPVSARSRADGFMKPCRIVDTVDAVARESTRLVGAAAASRYYVPRRPTKANS